MSYAWAGTSLGIDLGQGKIEKKPTDAKLRQTFLGGKGINARLFWDRVPPEVEPFSADNLLAFTAGALTGTPVPTANKVSVNYKSPLMNLLATSNIGGYWAAEQKQAGYDSIIISGKAAKPVYIWINDDKVEIRDASHLWGKDTVEAQRIVREELKDDKVQTVCIGPAGENRNTAAVIQHGAISAAGRGGAGAVMGDKKLKLIAIRGTKDIGVAQPSELMELASLILQRSVLRDYFHNIVHVTGLFAQEFLDWGIFGNVDEMPMGLGFEDMGEYHREFVTKHLVREPGCYNCPIKCMITISVPEVGRPLIIKCTSWWSFMCACKILDLTFSMKCLDLCFRYGLDHLSTANRLAFAIALYQNGILTKKDTGGMALEYGNREVAYALIEQMARREGVGDILANGVQQAAQMIGKGAEKYAYHIKGIEIKFHTYFNPYLAFTTAIGDRADTNCAGTGAMTPSLRKWRMETHEYIKQGWWVFPDEWEKYLYTYRVDYEGLAEVTSYGENIKTLTDLTGLCWISAGFWSFPAVKLNIIPKLISAATGMDIDETEAVKIARRIRTLIQAYNVRLGLRRKDDTVPEKFFQAFPAGYQKEKGLMKLDHDKFERQLDRYYLIRGWNRSGIPTRETLNELGLGYVGQDLEQRGIL